MSSCGRECLHDRDPKTRKAHAVLGFEKKKIPNCTIRDFLFLGLINHRKWLYHNEELFVLCVVPTGHTEAWLPPHDLEKQGATARTLHHATGVVVVARKVVREEYVEIAD